MCLHSKLRSYFNGVMHVSISQVTHMDPILMSHSAQNYCNPVDLPRSLKSPITVASPSHPTPVSLPSKSVVNPSCSSWPLHVPLLPMFLSCLPVLQESLLAASLPLNLSYTQQPEWSFKTKICLHGLLETWKWLHTRIKSKFLMRFCTMRPLLTPPTPSFTIPCSSH